MATWVNNQHLENWAGVDGIYLTYTADVTRSGNTITVSNQVVTWRKQGYSSASGYWYALYLDRNDNGNWARVQTVWSGNMTFGLYEYPTYTWYPSNFTFTADATSTSRQFRFINSDGDGIITFNFTFPEGYTAPATPTLTLTPAITSVSATYGTSSFGNPSTGTITLYGDTSSTPTTVLDSKSTTGNTTYSHTGLTANTKYYYKAYADNTKKNSTKTADTVTKVNAPTVSVSGVTGTSITVSYSTAVDGGFYDKAIQYSIDGGTTWVTGATVTGGSASSGTYTISSLTTGTTYTIQTRVTTTAGTTTGSTLTATTGPNVPTLSLSNQAATSIKATFSEDAFNSTTGRTLKLYNGTSSSPSTLIYTESNATDGTSYTYSNTGLQSNKRYYYKVEAIATFNGIDVSVFSDVKNTYTKAPNPTSVTATWVEFTTPTTQKITVTANIPADQGALTKTIQYRTTANGTTSSWATLGTVSSGSATTVTGDISFTNSSSSSYTATIEIRTSTSVGATSTKSTTITIKAAAGAPTVSSWTLVDNNSTTVAITGNNTVFIEGYSIPKIAVNQSAITLADSATIQEITGNFDNVTQNLTLSSGVYQAFFADPSSGTKYGTLHITDSLGLTFTEAKARTVLPYTTPTITGSYTRTGLGGEIDLSLAGTYSTLDVGGVEKNALTVSYKVSSSTGTVVDWTTVQVDRDNGVYTALVENIPVDYSDDFLVEFKVVDSLENAEGSLVVTAINTNSILRTPQYDIEVWTRDGTFVADISKYLTSDLQITWKLDDIEELSFDISMDAMEILSEAGTYALLTPYAHDIRIRRDGQYVVGCQIVEANLKIDNEQIPSIQVRATGFLNIFKDQYISMPMAGYSYPVMAHELLYMAQHSDWLLRNPTGDIDASYWLSPNASISQTTVAKSGAGAIQCSASSTGWRGLGSQMTVKAGTPINIDMWVSGQATNLYVRERELINISSTQGTMISTTLSSSGTYTHITGTYTTIFDNGYVYIEQDQTTNTPIRVDNCFISRVDDEDALNNHYIETIFSSLDGQTSGQGHNYATSSYVSTREFNYELQNVKDAVMDLVNLGEDQFDFEFTPDRIFNTYERKGADKPELAIVYPGNIHTLNITRSAADMANKIQNIGSGIGDERLEVLATDLDSRQEYGTRESVITNNNVSLEETLQGQADGELIDRKEPTRQITVTIQDGSINCANVETGDVLPFKLECYKGVLHQQLDKDHTPTNLLSSMEGWYKIETLSSRASTDGVETTTLSLKYLEPFEPEPTPEEGYGQLTYYIDNNYVDRKIVNLTSASDVAQLYWTEGTHESATIGGETIPIDSIYSVKLSSDVTSIPAAFLMNDTHLEKLDISEANLTSIPANFLNGCTSFNEKFDIPSTVTSVGSYFLAHCTSFNKKVVLPNLSSATLGQYFMDGCSSFNQQLDIPTRLTTIPNYFLRGCSSFNQPIVLPPNLTTIGSCMLYECSKFNQPIEIPSTVTSINSYFLGATKFNYPLVIPSGVTRIYSYFLTRCADFNSPLTLSPNITRIDSYFLYSCTSFNQPLDIPSGITLIDSAFMYVCSSFDQPITIPSGLTRIYNSFMRGCSVFNQPITIPSGVTQIDAYFLRDCLVFNYPINIPSGVTSIGAQFLYNCKAYNYPITVPSGVTEIKDQFMQSCVKFNSALTLPSGITKIGINFLQSCNAFNQPLTLPSSLTSLGNNSLCYLYYFNQPLTIPTGLTVIGDSFLRSAQRFNQTLTLPSNTTSIGTHFMNDARSFNKDFTIPSSVTSIGIYFFGQQRNMKSNIIVGSVNASVAEASDYTLSAAGTGYSAYTTGIAIKGSARSSWLSRFPNRTANPYRKLRDGGA